jgi:ribosome-binding factor A
MPSIRIQRFEKELLKLISKVVSFKLGNKDLDWVSISRVKLSPDLSYAKIYFTHMSDKPHEKVKQSLTRCSGIIKQEIASAKMMRIIPEITFYYDDLEEKADHLEDIFRKIHQEKEISPELETTDESE